MAKKSSQPINLERNVEDQQNLTLKAILSNAVVPYWWQIDVPIAGTEKELRGIVEDISSKKSAVLAQIDQINQTKTALLKAIEEDEEEFRREKASIEEMHRLKEEEITLYEEQVIAEKEAILAEREKQLEEARHEEELSRFNAEALERQLRLKAENEKRKADIDRRIAEVACLTDQAIRSKEELEKKFRQLEEERDALYPLHSKIKNYAGEYIVKQYEKYNQENMLEIVDLCLFDKTERHYVLHTPIINVRRNRTTVITSSAGTVQLLTRVLHRTLGTNFNVVSGEVRLEGENVLSMYRDDYKQKFQGKIYSFAVLYEQLLNSEKNVYDTLSVDRKDAQFALFASLLLIDQNVLNKKGVDMSESEAGLATLCYLFSKKDCLVILETAFKNLNKEDCEKAIDVINANTIEATVLILTTDTDTALKFYDSNFYKF